MQYHEGSVLYPFALSLATCSSPRSRRALKPVPWLASDIVLHFVLQALSAAAILAKEGPTFIESRAFSCFALLRNK